MQRTPFQYADGGDSHAIALVAAVVVSVAVHFAIALFAGSAKVVLPGPASHLTAEQRLALRRDSAMRLHKVPPQHAPAAASEEAEGGEARAPQRDRASVSDVAERLLASDESAPSALFAPPPSVDRPGDPLAAGVAPPRELDAPPAVLDWQPREEVMMISSRFANDDIAAIPRLEVPDAGRMHGAPDVSAQTTVSAVMAAVANGGGVAAGFKWIPAPPPPGEVETPEALRDPAGGGEAASEPVALSIGAADEKKPEAFFAEVPEEVAPAEPIEAVLKADVKVYRPGRGDGHAYFEIEVSRKGGDVLPPIPRDIVFAQDASRSIPMQRMAACREAVEKALSGGLLKEGDRFEITAFNTTNAWAFGKSWREVSAESLAQAVAFASSMRPDGNTDIYSTIREVLALPRSRSRATIAVMVSDGNATQGGVSRDPEIIGEFSRLNGGGVSVYTVGVSPGSNDYLLSMLSFCNRGGAATIPKSRFAIPDAFGRLLSSISTPVLTGLRFVFDTSSGAVVTPATTENLYLERPLRLFGRVPADAESVVFQVRGENGGKTYDMVFDLPLGSSQSGAGDPAIARNWATTRIYDLFAEHIRTGDPAALSEMAAIAAAHGVQMPFGGRLGHDRR